VIRVPGQDAISRDSADQALPLEAPPELRDVAALLRQARTAQGISQVDLAQRLHMGLQQLEALEQADRAALPEPVFVIAQARRVADALGLEINDSIDRLRRCESFGSQGPALKPEAFARSVQSQSHAPAQVPAPAPAAAVPAVPARSVGSRSLRWALLLALAAGISIAAWQLQRRGTPEPVVARPETPSRPSVSAPLLAQRLPATVSAKVPAEPVLVLQARQPSWLEVRSQVGGAVLFRGTLVGERRFALGQGLRVLAGRPDRVMVRQGRNAPKALGPISAVRWFSFGAALKR
jgi:transcriptional regulator with XRE-family HTH domain